MKFICLIKDHDFEETEVLVTPPYQFIQIQAKAILKTCKRCEKQELIYEDDGYNACYQDKGNLI